MKVPFFKTAITGDETSYVQEVLRDGNSFSQKNFISKCETWFANNHGLKNFFLTKSCTHSLELAALTLGIKTGDEVIMPSFAFVACANAIALRGATCVFVDIEPNSMNIDTTKIEAAITPKTKAILTINYSGVACDYIAIKNIAQKHKLFIIEDNAHGTGAKHGENSLGTFGDISTFSFDHLKNISCGQGGGIGINNESLLENFFVHYEFGTNRRNFFKGKADRYEWKNLGSNFPLSELNAAMLYSQLENIEKINDRFVQFWNLYFEKLTVLKTQNKIGLPKLSTDFHHNAHCFFIKTKNEEVRNALIQFLQTEEISAQFHYPPLHSSEFGLTAGRFNGNDEFTTIESKSLLRLPLYYNMTLAELNHVASKVLEFYSTNVS